MGGVRLNMKAEDRGVKGVRTPGCDGRAGRKVQGGCSLSCATNYKSDHPLVYRELGLFRSFHLLVGALHVETGTWGIAANSEDRGYGLVPPWPCPVTYMLLSPTKMARASRWAQFTLWMKYGEVLDVLRRVGASVEMDLFLAVFTYGRRSRGNDPQKIRGQPLPDHGQRRNTISNFHGRPT